MEWSLSLLEFYIIYALFGERCSIFLHGSQTFNVAFTATNVKRNPLNNRPKWQKN
jgi:hypothetical protein